LKHAETQTTHFGFRSKPGESITSASSALTLKLALIHATDEIHRLIHILILILLLFRIVNKKVQMEYRCKDKAKIHCNN
jgi:hypothetical protein